MHTFEDTEGRTWSLDLTYGSARRVKQLLGVDLLNPLDGEAPSLLNRLALELMLLCDVIYALIKPQADELGVSDEEWAAAMGGGAMLAAQDALYEEMAAFSRSLGRTDTLTAIRKQKEMIARAVQANEKRIEEADVEKEIGKAFGAGAMNSPESAESSPGPTA